MPFDIRTAVKQALNVLKNSFQPAPPDIAVVLGSGLGAFAETLQDAKKISYSEIPSFPVPTIPGHAGDCLLGSIGNRRVLIFRGRFHYYEGHCLAVNTLPIRVASGWGIRTLVVTNAAGTIRSDLRPGGLLLIKDHINLMGANPLYGPNLDEFGPRFIDMTDAYDEDCRALAKSIARRNRIPLPEGVYAALSGPSYETPAEIRMLATLGADVVGMSTVPEVIVARHHGMNVLGLSCMTNYASGVMGLASKPITHEEVIENTRRASQAFATLLTEWIKNYEPRA